MEWLDLVDENDSVIGRRTREWFYQTNNHFYRVINVFVYNKRGEVLLQKRSEKSLLFPGKYDFSVGGHVQSKESYIQAAIREVKEELGIDVTAEELKEIGYFRYPNELQTSSFSKLYVLHDTEVEMVGGCETDTLAYRTVGEIQKMLCENELMFKSDYRLLFEYYLEWRMKNNDAASD